MQALHARQAKLHDVRVRLPATSLHGDVAALTQAWRLNALDDLEGNIEAFITDAAWSFDADVTLPILGGRIDFNGA
jgi:hypothetical protein